MTQPFPPPKTQPFERLQVQDGLLMNAERWRRAHEYHRQRQNVHYQSLNQPGIVCDLGVRLIPAPTEVSAQYRDGRWLQIQPGLAIDLLGNIIVVPEPIDYRITTEVATEEAAIVYLVVSYVDPEKLRRKEQREFVQETFRIDEKPSPPSELEVELCRIFLTKDTVQLENPTDVFFPQQNALDLRYRTQAKSRSQAVVSIAQINSHLPNLKTYSNLSYLLQSVAALYPAFEGADKVGQLTMQSEEKFKLENYDLLYLSYQPSQSLKVLQWDAITQYIESGGVLLVEISTEGTNIQELRGVQQELKKAIANLELNTNAPNPSYQNPTKKVEVSSIRQKLKTEIADIKTDLDEQISQVSLVFKDFAQTLGTPLESLEHLNRNHPLRTQPFLFAALPVINEQEIQLLVGGGIIVIIGNLSTAWGLDETLSFPRETIRTAQELGINILNFSWRRRQLMQSQQPEKKLISQPTPPRREKQKNLRSVFEQLE
jgi:hypothetical protein